MRHFMTCEFIYEFMYMNKPCGGPCDTEADGKEMCGARGGEGEDAVVTVAASAAAAVIATATS